MSTTSPLVTAEEPAALQGVPQRVAAARATNDAEAYADVFTEDATLILPGDIFLNGKEGIRSFMAAGYSRPFKGARTYGEPLSVSAPELGAAVTVTSGGALDPERAIRATWFVMSQGGPWRPSSCQNTPIGLA